MRRIEIFSWQVWELWEQEWPEFQTRFGAWWYEVRLTGAAIMGRLPEPFQDDRGYFGEILHQAMDVITEGIRLIGYALIIFGYTIAHVLVAWGVIELLWWVGPKIWGLIT